jgi:hypothetical protein
VVAVAAIDSVGGLASFSQFGATTVDLGAPGVAIQSTVPNSAYGQLSGTSMATPHVTGAAALCASMNPGISAAAIRNALVSTVAPTASLAGKTLTGGRLDVGAMMQACLPAPTAPVTGDPSGLTATANDTSSISLSWVDGAADESRYDVERAVSTAGVCGTYALIASVAANSTSYTSVGLAPGSTYCFRVRALNTFNGGTASAYSNEAQATTKATPPPFACAGAPYSWVDPSAGASYVLVDDASASVALPFPVTLYGDVYTTASISSNGFLRLGSGAATAFANVGIPSATDPNAIIAPWWDDLNPALGGSVRTLTTGIAPNRKFVAAWVGVPHIAAASTAVTFEAVIDEATGDITFQYLDALTGNATSDRGVGATIGLENGAGSAGIQVSLNTASRSDQTAVRCTTTGSSSPLSVATTSLPGAATATAYSQMLQAQGGRLGYTWALATGTLPTGLTLNAATGLISGTPTVAGTSNITVRVTDGAAAVATAPLSIVVTAPLAISTASLPSVLVGATYSATLAATGGTAPYTWSIAAGALPAGLSLNATTGAITGTPTVAGTASVTFRATDSAARTITKVLSIAVTSPPLPGAFNKSAPANNATGRSRTALALSWAASTNATRYEYCVDTVNDNVCNTTWVSTGTARTVTIGGLGSRTAYFWQVRAVNAVGTTLGNAGTWWRFTTAV